MAELACLSLDKRIEEVRPYNKEVTGITYLRLTDTLKVLDELSDILYKGGYCDLNQSDNCKRGDGYHTTKNLLIVILSAAQSMSQTS